jgi:uncharacterized membrane protein
MATTAFFFVILAFIVSVFVFVVYAGARNWKAMKDRGVNPITAQAEIAARLAKGRLIEGPSMEERLNELDDLRARGLITDDEHSQGRARILGGD